MLTPTTESSQQAATRTRVKIVTAPVLAQRARAPNLHHERRLAQPALRVELLQLRLGAGARRQQKEDRSGSGATDRGDGRHVAAKLAVG